MDRRLAEHKAPDDFVKLASFSPGIDFNLVDRSANDNFMNKQQDLSTGSDNLVFRGYLSGKDLDEIYSNFVQRQLIFRPYCLI